jgi:RNA polymerase sigma-70 factor (ECF subfamily)
MSGDRDPPNSLNAGGDDDSDPPSASTEELLHLFQGGDRAALQQLWLRYLPRLRRWAHGRLPRASRNAANTEDLIQETFLRTVERLRTLVPRGPRSVFAYFRTVVLNQIRDYARQNTRRPGQDVLDPERHGTSDPSPLEQLLGREVLVNYDRALSTLREEEQQIIVAYVELRCSDRELAELFEKPSADAARVARARALARLIKALKAGEK